MVEHSPDVAIVVARLRLRDDTKAGPAAALQHPAVRLLTLPGGDEREDRLAVEEPLELRDRRRSPWP